MADPLADTPENAARASIVAARILIVANQAPDLLILANQFLKSEERVLKGRQDLTSWATDAGFTVTSEGTVNDVIVEIAPQVPDVAQKVVSGEVTPVTDWGTAVVADPIVVSEVVSGP